VLAGPNGSGKSVFLDIFEFLADISLAKPSKILFFTKDEYGLINVVPGNEHPKLREWEGMPDLGTLFASGMLNKIA